MQPESSMDPGQISIQKHNEAREIVTIAKQRYIFLENKMTIQRRFTSSKVRLSGLRPEPFQQVGENRSKERDRKSELLLGSTYQIFERDRNKSDRNFDFRETNRIAADRIF